MIYERIVLLLNKSEVPWVQISIALDFRRSLSEIVIKASELLESRENTGYSDQWRLVFVLDLSG